MNILKEINSKNRTCCYFDDIIKFEDFDFNIILLDEKSCKNILVYDISYKTLLFPIIMQKSKLIHLILCP